MKEGTIPGANTLIIKSYLSSRTFVIKIKDTYSEIKDIKVGVRKRLSTNIMHTIHDQHTNKYQQQNADIRGRRGCDSQTNSRQIAEYKLN